MDLDQLVYEPQTPALCAGARSPFNPFEYLFGADVFAGLDLDEGDLDEDE